MNEKENLRFVKQLVHRTHIILAGRIIRSETIPQLLKTYGIYKELGIETISDILDKLEENKILTIKVEGQKCDDGKYDCITTYFLLNPDTNERELITEFGETNLETIFGNNGLE